MSPLLISLVLLFLVGVFWQFGGRLSARYAVTWWAGGFFLLFCTAFPSALGPVARFLGVELISNFVIAGLILFLFFQSIDLTSDLSKSNRLIRRLISEEAAYNPKINGYGFLRRAQSECLVVLPCFNEEESLNSMIENLKRHFDTSQGIDFLIVDDGSLDNSRNLLSAYVPKNFLFHKANIGVAGVLMTGFRSAQNAEYEFVIQCDSDGQHPIAKVKELLEQAKRLKTDLLIGSRFVTGLSAGLGATTMVRVIGIYMLRLSLSLFGRSAKVTDPTSGFRVYSRKAVDVLLKNMPDEYPEPESIAILSLAGLKISEYPVEMIARKAGVSSISGIRQLRYFAKVTAALLGLRLRRVFARNGMNS